MSRLLALCCLLVLVAAPAAADAAGRRATARALGAQMRLAGPSSGALVVDLESGRTVYGVRSTAQRMPASVEKLYTSATALRRLGALGRLSTTVLVADEPDADGIVQGHLYLRGGGDPALDVLDLGRLAQQVRDAGITAITGRVVGDESAWDSRRGVPSSAFRLTSDVGPLSALVSERGRTGRPSPYWEARPARATAAGFARQLRHLGVDVPARVREGRTPRDAEAIAAWRSAPLGALLREMNVPSDNFIAEMLLKALGAQDGRRGTTAAGAAVVRREAAALGIAPQVRDGSGLSRGDRTSPREVVTLLEALQDDDAFVASLATAGRTGTLETRMRGTGAQDRCRAKTGTLHDVSALAGYCTTLDGGRVAFAVLMNFVDPYGARILQDRMASALVRYGRRTPDRSRTFD